MLRPMHILPTWWEFFSKNPQVSWHIFSFSNQMKQKGVQREKRGYQDPHSPALPQPNSHNLPQAHSHGTFSSIGLILTHILISSILGTTAARIQICPRSKKWRLHQNRLPLTPPSHPKKILVWKCGFLLKHHRSSWKRAWPMNIKMVIYVTFSKCLINVYCT